MRPTRTVVIPAAVVSALVILALVVMQLRIGAPTAQTPTAHKDKPAAQQEDADSQEEEESESGMEGEGEAFPPALAQHLEELAKTSPGNEGMEEEGPGSAAEAAFIARA